MLLKEALSIFSLATGLFTISGFAIKIDKFENNHIFKDPTSGKAQMLLPITSFNRLNLRSGENFKYFIGTEQRVKEIFRVETHNNHATLIFDEYSFSSEHPEIEAIKYYLESKPFWINLLR